jgi:hypothetical protein
MNDAELGEMGWYDAYHGRWRSLDDDLTDDELRDLLTPKDGSRLTAWVVWGCSIFMALMATLPVRALTFGWSSRVVFLAMTLMLVVYLAYLLSDRKLAP